MSSLDFSSNSSIKLTNSNNMKEYVKEFKKEIEEKYNNSKMNKNYEIKSKNKKKKLDSEISLSSLKDISHYDLKYQNIDNFLIENDKENITIKLINLIKHIRNLDYDYLLKIFKKPNNKLLNNLNKIINKKLKIDKKWKVENKSKKLIKNKNASKKTQIKNLKFINYIKKKNITNKNKLNTFISTKSPNTLSFFKPKKEEFKHSCLNSNIKNNLFKKKLSKIKKKKELDKSNKLNKLYKKIFLYK